MKEYKIPFADYDEPALKEAQKEAAEKSAEYVELVEKAIAAHNAYIVTINHPILDENGALTDEYAKLLYLRHREANFRATDANAYLVKEILHIHCYRNDIENARNKKTGLNYIAYIPRHLRKTLMGEN